MTSLSYNPHRRKFDAPQISAFEKSLITHNSFFSLPLSVLMKLSRPANLSPKSRVRTIFLPSSAHIQIKPSDQPTTHASYDNDLFDRNENYLRRMTADGNNLANLIAQVNQNEISRRKAVNRTSQVELRSFEEGEDSPAPKVVQGKRHRRRNDKFLHRRPTTPDDRYWLNRDEFASNSIDYVDCVAVGWGKYRSSGDLSDALLKIEVPIQNIKRCVDENKNNPSNSHRVETRPFSHPLQPNLPNVTHLSFATTSSLSCRCEEVYSDFVSLHQSQHLCAGNMNGKGGTCVGDSGGGLQCKMDKNGPWILVGITSFGSGCAKAGYPDVFTNVAYYRTWIDNAIRSN